MRRAGIAPAAATALALLLLPFLLRLPLLERRGFNPDELEHTHFAWCVSKGLVPYRDYFEHHTPWLHYLLQPLFRVYAAETSGDDALALLAAARRVMWVFAGLGLLALFGVARAVAGRREAWAAALLLANAPIFLSKSLEVRPDVPAAALLMGSVWLAARAFARERRGAPAWRALFGSGLLLGAAAMFTQKVVFALPGFAVACAWEALRAPGPGTPGRRLARLAPLAAGAALPVVLTLAYFAARGALWLFVYDNFLLNANWPGLGAREFLLAWLREDTLLVLLGTAGCAWRVAPLLRRDTSGESVVALSGASLVAAFAVHPAVTFHYFLLVLPFVAVFAGIALVRGLERLLAALARAEVPARRRAAAAAVATLIAVLVLGHAWLAGGERLRELLGVAGPAAVVGTAAVAALLLATALARGSPAWTLAAVFALTSLHPLLRLHAAFQRGNWMTVQGIRYVLRNVAPWEPCLDGFTGLGLVRPHAFFHPFQNAHTLAIQTPEQRRTLLADLESGAVLPKLIFWNHYLKEGVTPELEAFLLRHYVPTGLEPIRIRPFDNGLGFWSDEAPRPFGWRPGAERAPHVIFDDKWRDPVVEDGVPVRRSRTARSGFVVPVKRPGEFRAVLRAKADRVGVPFAVELVVNGRSAGQREAAARWQDYGFDVPAGSLLPGFNQFELRFHAPGPERRTELAVESLTLVRPGTAAPAMPAMP